MDMALLAGTGVLIAAVGCWWSIRAYRRMVARHDEARERDEAGHSQWDALLTVLALIGVLILIAVIAEVVWG